MQTHFCGCSACRLPRHSLDFDAITLWQVAQELCKEEEQDGVDRAAIHRLSLLLRSLDEADPAQVDST